MGLFARLFAGMRISDVPPLWPGFSRLIGPVNSQGIPGTLPGSLSAQPVGLIRH